MLFSCVNICQVPRKLFEREAALLFFHFGIISLKNVIKNALKMLEKKTKTLCCWYAINL